MTEIRKDAERDVRHNKDADRYGNKDGYPLVDGKKQYHEAGKNQEY